MDKSIQQECGSANYVCGFNLQYFILFCGLLGKSFSIHVPISRQGQMAVPPANEGFAHFDGFSPQTPKRRVFWKRDMLFLKRKKMPGMPHNHVRAEGHLHPVPIYFRSFYTIVCSQKKITSINSFMTFLICPLFFRSHAPGCQRLLVPY